MKKTELIDIVKNLDERSDTYLEIVNVLSFSHVEEILDKIYEDSEIHMNVRKDINSFIKLHRSPAESKIKVLEEISKTRLKKTDLPTPGKVVNVYQWVGKIYKTSNEKFFKDFVEWIILYTKNPQGQGSTGVGRGEHFLIFFGKGGKFANKGDVIFDGVNCEVKNNGEIYLAPNPYRGFEKKIDNLLGVKGHGITNLKTLVRYTNTNRKDLGYDKILNIYCKIYKEMFSNVKPVNQNIRKVFKKVISKDGSTEQKIILEEFKNLLYNIYKSEYKFDSILFFEISKGKSNMAFTSHPKQVKTSSGFSISGLNFINGNRGSGLRIAI